MKPTWIKSCVIGGYVFSISLQSGCKWVTFYVDFLININKRSDHCPMASLNIGIMGYIFEVECHYQDHRQPNIAELLCTMKDADNLDEDARINAMLEDYNER